MLGMVAISFSCVQQSANAYVLSTRWDTTATDGGGLNFGDPTTVTWSIVPNGTPIQGDPDSDLIAVFDNAFGAGPGGSDLTQRPWFTHFEEAVGRWSELSGLNYVYEPNDDGVQNATQAGVLGVRGDARIGGSFQDGMGGVLAFNFFPDVGDMWIDTGDIGNYAAPANDFRFLRNVIMHELGHGIGISHVESNNAGFLMEPFINLGFDGPQLDDIRAVHRGYGDVFEKANNGNGNDVIGNAIDLGVSSTGSPIVIGTDGGSLRVERDEVDFVSIDDNGDTDFWSFTIDNPGTVNIDLMPQGTTYSQGPQGGTQNSFSSLTTSDLTLAFFDSNQTLIATVDNTNAGSSETINSLDLAAAGEYYVRVTGTANNIQFYQLTVDFTDSITTIDVDFDDDNLVDCQDIDALVAEIASGGNSAAFDLTGDGLVNDDDLDLWLTDAGAINLANGNPYLDGDANLDGFVDGSDFNVWNQNAFTNTPAWCSGDFNADGSVDGSDFNIWNANKFTSSDHVATVPEPSSGILLIFGALAILRIRRR